VNSEFNYPNYFVMIPSGPDPKPAFTRGFFDVALLQKPKPQTLAIVAADQEFSRNAADGARENLQQAGLKLVYDRTYPPATVDFAPIVRAIAAANPDLVVVCSYPSDSGHGRAAGHGDQDTAWTAAQRFHQLRVLAAGGRNCNSPA
jgi:branched-chain amino acid transport system substrate-binding protein